MSKLTNCQIRAQIERLEAGIAHAIRRGRGGVWRRKRRLEAYRAELAEREAQDAREYPSISRPERP